MTKKTAMTFALGLLSIAAISVGICTRIASAQMGGGIGFGQIELIRQIRESASAMRKYRCAHEHFPQTTSEMDDALRAVFQKVSMTQENPSITPQSRNNFRYYYQFQIAFDQSIRALPVINGRVTVPNNWQAPPNTITILTDGGDMMGIWAASADEKPISDPTTGNPMVILQTIKCEQQQQPQQQQQQQ